MTNVGILERKHGPEMSEAAPSLEIQEAQDKTKPGETKEVDQMTAAVSNRSLSNGSLPNRSLSNGALSTKHFHDVSDSRRIQPTGLARLVMSISLSMLSWAASRAERDIHSSTEQSLIVSEARARAAREQRARLLQLRVR
jgi:hypothetical protein